jgi:hypothetical protein
LFGSEENIPPQRLIRTGKRLFLGNNLTKGIEWLASGTVKE